MGVGVVGGLDGWVGGWVGRHITSQSPYEWNSLNGRVGGTWRGFSSDVTAACIGPGEWLCG